MYRHTEAERHLQHLIRQGLIAFGGNTRLKIFGTLRCGSGKRMKKENRVFFESASEAQLLGYRPCAHCLPDAYRTWKSEQEAG